MSERRHILQWQKDTSRNGPLAAKRTAPHRQLPVAGTPAFDDPMPRPRPLDDAEYNDITSYVVKSAVRGLAVWEILLFCRDVAAVASARRRAVSELEALGGRHLADIGLDRADIAAYVRSGWPWPPSPFARRPRLRPSLRGCG